MNLIFTTLLFSLFNAANTVLHNTEHQDRMKYPFCASELCRHLLEAACSEFIYYSEMSHIVIPRRLPILESPPRLSD
jgi:hypothetical protein